MSAYISKKQKERAWDSPSVTESSLDSVQTYRSTPRSTKEAASLFVSESSDDYPQSRRN